MKSVILYGSARKSGTTRKILDEVMDGFPGEVEVFDAYSCRSISPCLDCRRCWSTAGCAIEDGMEDIYRSVERADLVVVASPVYFFGLPGPLKSIVDRFQCYWAGPYKRGEKRVKRGVGVQIFTGGAPRFPGQFKGVRMEVDRLFCDLGIDTVGTLEVADTDRGGEYPEEAIRELKRKISSPDIYNRWLY